jgi:UDP-N-acetyl-D-mannosaminuronic acid dehydrogenase
LGYIGLPTATIIAKNGIKVNGIDTNKEVVEAVNNSIPHIKEKGIENNLKEAISTGNFRAFSSPQESDIYIFAVPTPTKEENNSLPNADTSLLIKAFKSVMPLIKKNDLIIIESTSPVGTTKKISEIFFDNTNFEPKDIHFVYCPERVIPGNMLTELVVNDRVIGGLTEEATNLAVNFYARFCKGKLFKTSASSAEFVKLAENAYRDVNIAFANELSIVAKNLELDILELISLANRHPRVKILNPGCGVGGHCIAVDPWFLASASPENTPLIQTARKVNDNKLNWVFEQILSEIKKIETNLGRKPIVGCFGITFKADVDDLRGSPAISIINKLINEGIEVLINEPNLKKHTTFKLFSIQDILKKSDLNVFLVNHTEYQNLNLNNNNVLDFCGIKK